MGMAKKGTRLISVDGVRYRWRARNPVSMDGLYLPTVEILVQAETGLGAKLLVRPYQDMGADGVYPGAVAAFIQQAIRAGWQPDLPGKVFPLRASFPPPYDTGFDSRWRTEHVVGLAARIVETGDYNPLPILADALEEAGCQHAEFLKCCREAEFQHSARWLVFRIVAGRPEQ